WLDLNQWPHPERKIARVPTGSAAREPSLAGRPILIPRGGQRPCGSYQQSTGNRCADGCFRRSRATVGVDVKCSNSLQLSALPTRPEPCRHCTDYCRPPAVHQASPPVSTCTYASTMLPQHPSPTSISISLPT